MALGPRCLLTSRQMTSDMKLRQGASASLSCSTCLHATAAGIFNLASAFMLREVQCILAYQTHSKLPADEAER